jgi:hypothetical protein
MPPRAEEVCSPIVERLRDRRREIEQMVLTRIHAVADPPAAAGPEYAAGLRVTVCTVLDYWIDVLEGGDDRMPPLPAELLNQARLAAHSNVGLDIVLRRCFAGHTLLTSVLLQEAERVDDMTGSALKHLLRVQTALFDCLVGAVTETYTSAVEVRSDAVDERSVKRVKRLLAGEWLDTSSFSYDFDNRHHLGMIAAGSGAGEAIRDLIRAFDRRPLMIRGGKDIVWAWLGSRQEFEPGELTSRTFATWPGHALLAIGEPAPGMGGWRLTHQQARAAFMIARRGSEPVVRYADIALLASALRDDLLVSSLEQLYLDPLEREQDGGATLRRTLTAYFAAGRNASSAAAHLDVSRQTKSSRLRTVEVRIGRPLETCAAGMETALKLQHLSRRQAG